MRNKITLAVLIMVLVTTCIRVSYVAAAQPTTSIKIIKIKFKLDPRLTRGVYMGDRWVSPPQYIRVQEKGKDLVVEAKAFAVDKRGRYSYITPEWKPANTSVIKVIPSEGQTVEIIVLREGESKLRVTFGDETRELNVRAVKHLGILKVDISQ